MHAVEKVARNVPQEPSPAAAPPVAAPDRKRMASWIGALGLLAAIVSTAWLTLAPSRQATVAGIPQPSVAVLPFRNLSDDAANAYFSEGIAEELLGTLARVPGLRVASRTSSFSFRDQPAPLAEVARILKVEHVVEGSVRKAGNRIRVTAQLIEVRTDSHLWSATYDRELADVLAIQQEIAQQIAGALKLQLGADASLAPNSSKEASIEAYQLYLRGKQVVQLRLEPNIRQAIGLLERSIRMDPANAHAHAELASAYALTTPYYREPDPQFMVLATQRAAHAIELNPGLSLPHAVLGFLALCREQWHEAEQSFRRAIALNANDAQARYWLGELYSVMGRTSDSLVLMNEAVALDPILAPLVLDISNLHLRRGDLEEACQYAERATKLTSDGYNWLGLARCLRRRGEGAAAEAAESRAEQSFGFQQPVFSLVQAARLDPAKKPLALAAIAAESARHSAHFQLELIDLGEYEAVFAALDHNQTRHNYNGLRDLWAADSVGLRAHPRFREFAARHGMLDFWRTSGWPDVCRPAGDGFTCD